MFGCIHPTPFILHAPPRSSTPLSSRYIDLRQKLDWTRERSSKEVGRIQKEANKLRARWMMAAGTEATLASLGIDNEDDIGADREGLRGLMTTAGSTSGNRDMGDDRRGGSGGGFKTSESMTGNRRFPEGGDRHMGDRPGTSAGGSGGEFSLRPGTNGTNSQSAPFLPAADGSGLGVTAPADNRGDGGRDFDKETPWGNEKLGSLQDWASTKGDWDRAQGNGGK